MTFPVTAGQLLSILNLPTAKAGGRFSTFPLLAAAYDLKERLYAIYDATTPDEAWGEYLHWESTIPKELAKPFRVVRTVFRNWKLQILNYFDDQRVTNAFTESFNSKIRAVYRNGRGYSFERLRAKVLYIYRHIPEARQDAGEGQSPEAAL